MVYPYDENKIKRNYSVDFANKMITLFEWMNNRSVD